MESLPSHVADDETVIRVIKSPHHLTPNKKGLRKQAFQPMRGTRELSVIRLLMGADFCKDKGVELLSGSQGVEYRGLAAGHVETIRALGAEVEDYPQDFVGHAHVISKTPHGADDPPEPHVLAELDAYYRKMVEHFAYHPDESAASAGWHGPALSRTA